MWRNHMKKLTVWLQFENMLGLSLQLLKDKDAFLQVEWRGLSDAGIFLENWHPDNPIKNSYKVVGTTVKTRNYNQFGNCSTTHRK